LFAICFFFVRGCVSARLVLRACLVPPWHSLLSSPIQPASLPLCRPPCLPVRAGWFVWLCGCVAGFADGCVGLSARCVAVWLVSLIAGCVADGRCLRAWLPACPCLALSSCLPGFSPFRLPVCLLSSLPACGRTCLPTCACLLCLFACAASVRACMRACICCACHLIACLPLCLLLVCLPACVAACLPGSLSLGVSVHARSLVRLRVWFCVCVVVCQCGCGCTPGFLVRVGVVGVCVCVCVSGCVCIRSRWCPPPPHR